MVLKPKDFLTVSDDFQLSVRMLAVGMLNRFFLFGVVCVNKRVSSLCKCSEQSKIPSPTALLLVHLYLQR
jgi:hypothetical protein